MSLFIGDLAFADPDMLTVMKIGVQSSSLASAIVGYTVLRLVTKTKP
ncbi:MAG: hypothetical protein EXR10_04195 [Alphaproteobacteria bacterium]|nr:hypothetical protein [Alphaproteobacteria bacterium]PHX99956.1 MAG: hypothetical protein CK529_07690 [Rhodospirillaceae bacterium]